MLAPAAADPVLELNCLVQRFFFFPIWKVFGFVFSCSHGLSTTCFSLDRDGPDKAQQLSSDCSHDLPLILACHAQLHVALMQAILRLPCDLDDCWGNTFVSLAQLFPDARQVSITPPRFHHDASEVRITGLGDAASSNAVAAGIFAGKYAAITHQLPCALEAGGDVAQLRCDRDCRDMRYTAQSLRPRMRSCMGCGASFTTSRMASSSRFTRALMCSTSFLQSRRVTSCTGCV